MYGLQIGAYTRLDYNIMIRETTHVRFIPHIHLKYLINMYFVSSI